LFNNNQLKPQQIMGFFSEFKEFAMKGNLLDLAVGFVMGAAFSKVTSSFIDGMVMPLVGMLQGKDFSNLYFGLNEAAQTAAGQGLPLAKAKEAGPVFAWGAFVTVTIEFIVVAFVMFMIIKGVNATKKQEAAAPAAPPEPTASEKLLAEIRDALKK
jgi:large conductance mechanosensitive channel